MGEEGGEGMLLLIAAALGGLSIGILGTSLVYQLAFGHLFEKQGNDCNDHSGKADCNAGDANS